MTVPALEQLGASTLNRMWRIDVQTGTEALPVWTPVRGRIDFKPAQDPTLQDDSDFDGEGWKSQTKTADAWSLEFKVARKVTTADGTIYDPGQEVLRLAGNEMGVANSVSVRWYELEPDGPRVEAYEGNAAVSWSPDGGGMDELNTASVTLSGQGKRSQITHPSPTV